MEGEEVHRLAVVGCSDDHVASIGSLAVREMPAVSVDVVRDAGASHNGIRVPHPHAMRSCQIGVHIVSAGPQEHGHGGDCIIVLRLHHMRTSVPASCWCQRAEQPMLVLACIAPGWNMVLG